MPRMLPRLLLALSVLSAPTRVALTAELRTVPQDLRYCHELAERLEAEPRASHDPVQSLLKEGVELCEAGYVRTGIARLRRAFRLAQGR